MIRKEKLYNGGVYHIYNKSIAGYKIFNYDFEFNQMLLAMKYYQITERPCKLSNLERFKEIKELTVDVYIDNLINSSDRLVNILSYCIMPTHYHLIVEQLTDNGISEFMRNIQNSYTSFFNNTHKRRGPLWQGPFKNKEILSDDLLSHIGDIFT